MAFSPISTRWTHPICFGEVNSSDTVVNHSAIHTRQAYGALVTKPLPSAKACECVSENTSDEFVSFFQWWTLIRAWLLDCLIAHLRHLENENAKTRH